MRTLSFLLVLVLGTLPTALSSPALQRSLDDRPLLGRSACPSEPLRPPMDRPILASRPGDSSRLCDLSADRKPPQSATTTVAGKPSRQRRPALRHGACTNAGIPFDLSTSRAPRAPPAAPGVDT